MNFQEYETFYHVDISTQIGNKLLKVIQKRKKPPKIIEKKEI